MKNIIYTFCLIVFGLLIACTDEQPTNIVFPNYNWSNNDITGGSWKTIILDPTHTINIETPNDITSIEYKTEIDNLKKIIDGATADEKESARYWGNNGSLRWNEIARDLAAKYNISPAPNVDGTYPVPDPANPSAYPNFPFAHPPYASRAFAYLSVAGFDALIKAWEAKYIHNRLAPSKIDNSIKSMFAATDLPSFPSEGATYAGVAQTILSAMFPLEKEFIATKVAENLKALLVSGQNVQSDLDAGLKLGIDVAKIALTRASTDKMKLAQAPIKVADSIKNVALTKYGWSFKNLDIPERKIGLVSRYGQVKTWSIPNIVDVRPTTPPTPGSEEYNKAEAELKDIAKNRTLEQRRIANFWADGTSTYTPPGHWNRIACDIIVAKQENPLRTARSLAYLNMAIQDAGIACWETKYHYHYPRPNQIITGFQTLLGTPNFPGYVSGHSSFSGAGASILAFIYPSETNTVQNWAKEASFSRMYGGIHFRFDCEEGVKLGERVASFTIEKAKVDGAN